jgi:hypothetical protein
MNIDKHIVIKEVGELTYAKVSPIYKAKLGYHLDINGYCADDIIFDPPLVIKWKYSEISIMKETTMVKKVDLEYDFGMTHEFFPDQVIIESPDNWKYRGIDLNSPILDMVKRYVEDQLIFALRRNPCELNYIHWALRGWLKERANFPWHNNAYNFPVVKPMADAI